MKKSNVILFFTVFFSYLTVSSQEIIFEESAYEDSIDLRYGQNGKNFYYMYGKYAWMINTNKTDLTSNAYSYSFGLGMRYKRKLSKKIDLVSSLGWMNYSYKFKQDSLKTFPSKGVHKREFLLYNDLNLEAAIRVNFGKRGNIIKTHLDIGGYINYSFSISHLYTDINTNSLAGRTDTRNYGLLYTYPYQYGAMARLGKKNYTVYSYYRLSNLFKSSYNLPELAKITIGIDIGIF